MLKVLFLVMFFASQQVHAGFLTGVATGALLAGDNKTTQSQSATVISDKYDVITCEQHTGSNYCSTSVGNYNHELQCNCILVQDFAKKAGYSKVHKTGIQFQGTSTYIIMEVEK